VEQRKQPGRFSLDAHYHAGAAAAPLPATAAPRAAYVPGPLEAGGDTAWRANSWRGLGAFRKMYGRR
jgi:hypothetical protein